MISGITVGVVGYALGNYLGIAIAYFLQRYLIVLSVDVGVGGVGFDKVATGSYVFAHQHRKDA